MAHRFKSNVVRHDGEAWWQEREGAGHIIFAARRQMNVIILLAFFSTLSSGPQTIEGYPLYSDGSSNGS